MSEQGFDVLERELAELGRSISIEPPRDDLVATVLARIGTDDPDEVGLRLAETAGAGQAAAPSGRPRWLRGRRLGWAVAAATVLVLALVPPVRAAVLELLHIGGVVVRQQPAPSGTALP